MCGGTVRLGLPVLVGLPVLPAQWVRRQNGFPALLLASWLSFLKHLRFNVDERRAFVALLELLFTAALDQPFGVISVCKKLFLVPGTASPDGGVGVGAAVATKEKVYLLRSRRLTPAKKRPLNTTNGAGGADGGRGAGVGANGGADVKSVKRP